MTSLSLNCSDAEGLQKNARRCTELAYYSVLVLGDVESKRI